MYLVGFRVRNVVHKEELCKTVRRNLFIQLLEACRKASETGTSARLRPFVFSLDRVFHVGSTRTERLVHVLGATLLITVKSLWSRACQESQHVVFSLLALKYFRVLAWMFLLLSVAACYL